MNGRDVILGVAWRFHEGSDHAADGAEFRSPICNCERLAGKALPMIAGAWDGGYREGRLDSTAERINTGPGFTYATNPYRNGDTA